MTPADKRARFPSTLVATCTGTAVARPTRDACRALPVGESVYEKFMLPAALAAALSIAACSGSSVQVLSSTTSPSSPPSSTAPTPPTRQLRGAIERIDASTSTIIVSGAQVAVPASATISNSSGSTIAFSDLHVGDVVSVTGTSNGGVVTATAITVLAPAAPPAVMVSGRVAALSGTCPSLTFAVSDTTVTTSASTAVTGGSCTDIANGVNVQVTGARQTGRSVAASQVAIRPKGSQ